MKRKDFLKKGIIGLSTIVAVPTIISSCKKDEPAVPMPTSDCPASPEETLGPFPIKTPAQLVRENIVGNRSGLPLRITINVQNINDNCNPIQGATVDVWHCDINGNYSEYPEQIDGDFTNENFLRGRQTTDSNGSASFISIFPGWYPGRTPHIHVEVKSAAGTSLLVTQISWSAEVSNTVYATQGYNGPSQTTNANDGIVSDENLVDSATGNATDGYTLTKNLKVNG